MKRIDKFLLGETFKDCTFTFKEHLPAGLRQPLVDLMQMAAELYPLQNHLITNKDSLKRFDQAFSRLCIFFKSDPSPLSRHAGVTHDNQAGRK